jgi:hypothetical protein
VRVTFEAEWLGEQQGPYLRLRIATPGTTSTQLVPPTATVEVLATPVYVNHDTTEFGLGDVVRDGDGDVYLRLDGQWIDEHGGRYDTRHLGKPLTLLVRDGEVVR